MWRLTWCYPSWSRCRTWPWSSSPHHRGRRRGWPEAPSAPWDRNLRTESEKKITYLREIVIALLFYIHFEENVPAGCRSRIEISPRASNRCTWKIGKVFVKTLFLPPRIPLLTSHCRIPRIRRRLPLSRKTPSLPPLKSCGKTNLIKSTYSVSSE